MEEINQGAVEKTNKVAVESNKKQRACPRVFIAIAVALAVIGAVLGVVFGYVLKQSTSTTGSTSNQNSTSKSGSQIPVESDQATNVPPVPIPPRVYEFSGARLEPPSNLIYTGFHIDWSSERPSTIVSFLEGRKPAIL
jgi:hypothetical protein